MACRRLSPVPGKWCDAKKTLQKVLTSLLGGAMIKIPSKLGNTVWEACLMDRDEILKRSREENKDRDFVEEAVLATANSLSLGVGMIVCGLVSVLSAIFQGGPEYSVWTVMWAIHASTFLFKYRKLRKRHELMMGLFYIALAVFFFVCYLHLKLGVF